MFNPPVSSGMKGPGPGSMDMYSAYKQQGKKSRQRFYSHFNSVSRYNLFVPNYVIFRVSQKRHAVFEHPYTPMKWNGYFPDTLLD